MAVVRRPLTALGRLGRGFSLVLHLGWLVLAATAALACHVLVGRPRLQPVVAVVPLCNPSDNATALLVVILNLTPGTLTVDLDTDAELVHVHSMFAGDPSVVHDEVADLERRIWEVLP